MRYHNSRKLNIIQWWSVQFSSVQSLSHVWLFVTPWIAARQASLSITNFWSLMMINIFKRYKLYSNLKIKIGILDLFFFNRKQILIFEDRRVKVIHINSRGHIFNYCLVKMLTKIKKTFSHSLLQFAEFSKNY